MACHMTQLWQATLFYLLAFHTVFKQIMVFFIIYQAI